MNRLAILMMINAMPMGGAETFFVRLATGLKKRGHTVVVHLLSGGGDTSLLDTLADAGIPVLTPWWCEPRIYRYFYKVSLIVQKLLPDFSLCEFLRGRFLRSLHRWYRFDVVNAHLTSSEQAACMAFRDLPLRIVGTDHGDYRYAVPSERFPEMEPVFKRSDALVCPSWNNLEVARRYPWSPRCQLKVVYYGYEFPRTRTDEKESARALFVFGMVSRGNEAEKGWKEAIEAFLKVRETFGARVQLLLVGGGSVINELRAGLNPAEIEGIEFAGYQSDPKPFIARFDVGLLPTYFRAESLPNVIIECLAQGKPLIATSIGGIPEMLRVGEETAGALVPLSDDGRASVPHLVEAMVRLVDDIPRLDRCRQLAHEAAKRFSMEDCLLNYEQILRGDTAFLGASNVVNKDGESCQL
jgi:glycosyltransferase involved in cell wall biosynthesis